MDQFQVFLSRKLDREARNELIAANAVTIFIVESLLKAVHDCIERVQIARPIIFSSTQISAIIRPSFATQEILFIV